VLSIDCHDVERLLRDGWKIEKEYIHYGKVVCELSHDVLQKPIKVHPCCHGKPLAPEDTKEGTITAAMLMTIKVWGLVEE